MSEPLRYDPYYERTSFFTKQKAMNNNSNDSRDKKTAIKAFLMWWLICFIILFFLTTLTDMVYPLFTHGKELNVPVLFRIIFSAVAAVPMNFIVFYLLLPRLNKQYKIYREIFIGIAREGYSERIIAEMEKQLDWCMKKGRAYATYSNQYAMFLTEAYLSLQNTDKANEYLNYIDYATMKTELQQINSVSVQRNMVMYHVLKVQLAAAMSDIALTERCISEGERYFSLYRNKSELMNYVIDTAYFESLMLHGRYNNALNLINKYISIDELRFGVSFDKARCLHKMGDKQSAESLFDEAYSLAGNDWRRRIIDIYRNSVNENKKETD